MSLAWGRSSRIWIRLWRLLDTWTRNKRKLHDKGLNNLYSSPINIIYLWLYGSLLDLGNVFSFLIPYTVGRTPRTGDQPVARPLPTHRTTQTQTSMSRVGFETTIPMFERAKTVHALDRADTVNGTSYCFLLLVGWDWVHLVLQPLLAYCTSPRW
jgi:hypothetical protein